MKKRWKSYLFKIVISDDLRTPLGVVLYDFDNGTIDFISCSKSEWYSNIYLNDGDLNFTEKLLNSDNEPIGNGVGDFNNLNGKLNFKTKKHKRNRYIWYF